MLAGCENESAKERKEPRQRKEKRKHKIKHTENYPSSDESSSSGSTSSSEYSGKSCTTSFSEESDISSDNHGTIISSDESYRFERRNRHSSRKLRKNQNQEKELSRASEKLSKIYSHKDEVKYGEELTEDLVQVEDEYRVNFEKLRISDEVAARNVDCALTRKSKRYYNKQVVQMKYKTVTEVFDKLHNHFMKRDRREELKDMLDKLRFKDVHNVRRYKFLTLMSLHRWVSRGRHFCLPKH